MSDLLEDIAIGTYKNNLQYFEKSQPEVFSKLAAFESAIEQNLYQSKYDLVINDDYFDVLELSTRNHLYNSNSTDYASLVTQSINYQKGSNVFESFKKVTISNENLKKFAEFSITENNLSGLAPILNYIQNNIPNSLQMKEIKKFIFFGTGLGQHISSVHKKISAQIYLIIEDDIELFKLSLFTMPYYELARTSNLIFSVFDSSQEFSKPAFEFLKTGFYNNHYIKYFQMINQSEDKIKEFQIKIAGQSHNLFYFNAILEQYLKPLDYLQNSFNFLNILKPIFDSKPILLLAAGPSLRKNIEWIKENKNRFVIVALSAVLSTLEKEKISPDIVTHIDGLEESIIHFTKLQSLEFLKDTSFLISSRTPREIVNLLTKDNVFFFENGTSYKEGFGNLSAPCVGSTSFLLLLALGVKDLYLIGLDLALDSKTGSTHSDGHEYAKALDLDTSKINEDLISFKDTVLQVDGNFQEAVYTTLEFINSINSINSSALGFKQKHQNVYNLSDGAYFSNTKSLHTNIIKVKKLHTFDKKNIKKEIHNKFTLNSHQHITDMELFSIEERHNHALYIKKILLTQLESNFSSSKEFLDSLVVLFNKLTISSSKNDYDLALVYQEYFRFISTFIFDFFNTKELTEELQHALKLNSILSTQLLRIVTLYISELHALIKESPCKT